MPELDTTVAGQRRADTAAEARPTLGALVEAALRRIGAHGGVGLVSDGLDAFELRVALARSATHSLDLQYYIWHGDVTGLLLAREVLAAADRGVRVRVLLDDVFSIGRERVLTALDAHPNIEVKLFNATHWRVFGRFGFALELLLGGWHLNRRMHNKLWIADGRIAMGGGRNIGDEYFDVSDGFNFRDLDLVLAGQSVEAAGKVFERYWSCRQAERARALSAASGNLPRLRREMRAAASRDAAQRLLARLEQVAPEERVRAQLEHIVDGDVRVVADPPEKALRGLGARRRARAAGGIAPEIAEALRGAKRQALISSPYFVPGDAGLALLAELVARGVHVVVVTNSLAATDVVAVHGGYARYRRRLLRAGVELYELKRTRGERPSVFGSRGASLHTKAFVVDGAQIYVGSFNLDPRSAALNTEMGIFVRHPGLARELAEEHGRLVLSSCSWRVELRDGHLEWTDQDDEGGRVTQREPHASLGRRLLSGLVRWLPVESQL